MRSEPVARVWHLPTPGGSPPQLAEIQRARLLFATLRVVDKLGCANASAIHITERAHVSRRTFYELFAAWWLTPPERVARHLRLDQTMKGRRYEENHIRPRTGTRC